MKLALKQVGGKVGDYTIKYESLDDSSAQAGAWTPEATSANARKVVQDKRAIAYLGEFNSGASAVSIPLLNEAGVPQNGLTNTAVGLTTNQPGSNPGEPGKYYPTGKRNYVRIVPKDTIQGAALVTLMKQDGCTKVFVLNDKDFSAALPAGRLYGPDGIAESGFADPAKGGIPADVQAKVKVVIATLPADQYPPEGQTFFADYQREFGESAPDPYAIYGFEAMSLTLDAIKRAAAKGDVTREAVVEQLFAAA